jgi:post-segregation antitoxin (ccd killing protein)
MNHVAKNRPSARLRQPVNITLSSGLVRRAKALTPNLSETVERLLQSWVTDAENERIAKWVDATNAPVAAHGLPGEDYGTLG